MLIGYSCVMIIPVSFVFFFFSSRRRHTRCLSDWSSDVCSSDLLTRVVLDADAFIGSMDSAISTVKGLPKTKRGATDPLADQIGRASCRKECRSRWSPYKEKKKKKQNQDNTQRQHQNHKGNRRER